MKPGFALSLSLDGITLLFRTTTGWRRVGEVRVDAPDMAAAMDGLRLSAKALSKGPMRSKLVLPNDQIRYLTVDTGLVDAADRLDAARNALEGATPYGLDELAFDISIDGPLTHIAAVARETLAEAESFAVEHWFEPVSFVARPDPGAFVGEPFFGQTVFADQLLADGDRVIPDEVAIEITGPVDPGEPSDPVATPTVDTPSADANAGFSEPVAGFTSRRRRPPQGDANRAAAPTSATDASTADTATQVKPKPPAAERPAPPPARPAPTVAPKPEIKATRTAMPLAAQTSQPKSQPRPVAPPVKPVPPSNPAARAAAIDLSLSMDEAEDADPRSGFIPRRRSGPPVPTAASSEGVTDAERMTVFGARETQKTKGKPRYLGLVLTVALLVFLVGVAAFASIFAENEQLGRLFGRDPAEAELALEDSTRPDTAQVPDLATIDPAILNMPANVVPVPDAPASDIPGADVIASLQAADIAPRDIATDAPGLGAPAQIIDSTPGFRSAPDALVDGTARDMAVLGQTETQGEQTALMLNALRAPTVPDTAAVSPDPVVDAVPAETPNEAATYAATGIWATVPDQPETPGLVSLDDLYVASIDGATLTQDALALPDPKAYATDVSLNGQASPAAAGIEFKLDALGLVQASPDGTVTPDGIVVYLGRPSIVPPPTPERQASLPEDTANIPDLPRTRPRTRPADLVENAERAQLGGLTLAELGGVRPKARPYLPEPEVQEPPARELTEAEARLASIKPKARPRDLAQRVAQAQSPGTASTGPAAAASTASTATFAPAPSSSASTATASVTRPSARSAPAVPRNQTTSPTAPSPTSVAKQATIKNAINLRQVNLIGVYGTPSNRRALVRLTSGRYKKVQVGDRLDGGRIVAIGDSELRYQKSGRNVVLRMPRG